MNEEIEKTSRSGADSISNDVVAGQTQTVEVVTENVGEKEINKQEIEKQEIVEEIKDNSVETKVNINVSDKRKKTKKEKKNRNTRTTLLFLLVLLLIMVAIGVTYLKIQDLKEKYKIEKEPESVFDEAVERKKSNEDELLVEFGDKYNVNDIKVISYIDRDGVISDYNYSGPSNNAAINRNYVQIEGLKNKEIQSSINDTLKNTVYGIDPGPDGKIDVYSYLQGNFSNILSVLIFYYEDDSKYQSNICLNFDLNTGDIIQFEDLFIDSAPIASLIANAALKTKAWQVDLDYDSMTDEEYFNRRAELYNMDNRDFSNAEDYAVEIANLYKEKKGKIDFVVSPKAVTIYNFNTSFLNEHHRPFVINFMENKESVAVYNRFDYKISLYENDISQNNVYVFTSRYNGYSGVFVNEGNLYIDINSSISNLDEKDANLLLRELDYKIANEIKKKSNANPNKKYVVTGYAYYSDVRYLDRYYQDKTKYTDAYLINNGVKKSVNVSYTLEIMDNLDDKRFGEIMAALGSVPSASADSYPVSQLNSPYLIDQYSYLHIPEIESVRENKVYYYDEYGVYKMSNDDLPSEDELQEYYYNNQLYYLGVDYGS